MLPEEQHTAYIVEAWNSMTTKRDLLALLNYAKPLAHRAKTEPFKLKQLSWYSHPRLNRARYTTFTIKKRSGGERIINAPVKTLKSIQKTLAYILQCIYEPQDPAKGFVRGRSIVDNARIHQGQNYVYNIDLKDFFPSIEQARVWKCLQLYPFGLAAKKSSDKSQTEHQGSRLATILGMKPGVFNLAGRGIPQYIEPKKTKQERISELTALKENIQSAPDIKSIRKSIFKVIGEKGYERFKKFQDELELSEKIEFEPGSSFAVIRDKVDKYLLPLYIDSLINALLGISPSNDLSSNNTEYVLDGQVVQQYSLGRHGKISFRASQSNEGDVEVTLENFQEAIEAAVLASFSPAAVLKAEDILKMHEQYDSTDNDVTHLLKSFPLTIHAHICKQLGISPNLKPKPSEESVDLVAPRVRLASIIAALCCTEMEVTRQKDDKEYAVVKRNVLPQGAPTSPVISNIVCRKLDHRLSGLARRFGLQYSRYADDITFSSMHNVYNADSEFLKELNRIITDQRFQINQSKTRLQKEGYRQEVTGLLVNEKVNVQRRYVKELRMWLYYWERYGFDRAYSFFLQQYKTDTGQVKQGRPDMLRVISGKLQYLSMVKGDDNVLYGNLKKRFDTLISPNLQEGKLSDPEIRMPESDGIIILNLSRRESTSRENSKRHRDLFPHNPLYTVLFLKKFKIGDGSGFKELVHDVILSDEIIKDILSKVKSHPNFVYHYKKELISDVSFLNRAIQKEVINLIDLFEKEGIPFYRKSSRHPFNNDSRYTNYARQFKKKYRYGSGSEYSKLQTDIINIFKDQRVPVSSLSFMPDERKFNIRSSFFTWQPSIYNGIRYLVQGISDHSNIKGVRPFDLTDKIVSVEVERINGDSLTFLELRILDSMSLVNVDSLTLLDFLQGSSPFKFDFRNLCDWIVECDFLDESSKRLNLLVAPEYSESIPEMVDLPFPVGGFKHILRFYDFR